MKEVEAIQAYKTSDGQIYADAEEAKAAQTEINVMRVIGRIVDDFFYYNIDRESIVSGIYEHVQEIIDAVKEETE